MYFLKVFLTKERIKNTHFIHAFPFKEFLSSLHCSFFIADFYSWIFAAYDQF